MPSSAGFAPSRRATVTDIEEETGPRGVPAEWAEPAAGDVRPALLPHERALLAEAPRVLGRIEAAEPGPSLVIVGGLHGNEPSGVLALARVFARIAASGHDGLAGRFVGLAGNRRALAVGERFLERDLNRIWLPELRRRARHAPESPDERELAELDREIASEAALAAERGQSFYLLDLHSTSAPGPAFVDLDDTLANRRFGFEFPVPKVLGLEEELAGTMTRAIGELGVTVLAFEAGQHDEPVSVDRAEAAVWIALEAAGLLPLGEWPEPAAARERLSRESRGLPAAVEVRYRHAIAPEDGFTMAPGFAGFDRIESGQPLALDRGGPVEAPEDGWLLMPLYQKKGEEGFFLVRSVRRHWIALSAPLRRMGFDRHLHRLPGVSRHPELERGYVVDRRVARFLPLELFHLLGFQRIGGARGRFLTFVRRREP